MPSTHASPPESTVAARAALARGDWQSARESFDEAIRADPSDSAAWEGLATAALWLEDLDRVIEARERSHALYHAAGDEISAARLALEIAGAYLELRGEQAVANGWFQRGRRALEKLPPAPEHALLHIWDAFFALEADLDLDGVTGHAGRAIEVADRVGAPDIAMLGRALQGMASVMGGDVKAGMSLLDEAVATALSSEGGDPDLVYRTCCCMLDACEQVRDYGRAVEWCGRLREFADRWRIGAFLGTCRMKYSGVLLWRGEWEAAEAELLGARDHLATTRPASAAAPLVRLAEVRRRQGRRQEAEALLDEAGTHPAAAPVRAALALDAGQAEVAADLLMSLLRRIPEAARTERIAALELLVRALLARGRPEEARTALGELQTGAEEIGTDPMRAAALSGCGAVALTEGDAERARDCFAEAAHLYEASGSPYECARTRVELSAALAALGHDAQARAEAAAALAVLAPMGAEPAADAARRIAGETIPPATPLTPRQREVLALAAEGLTDREMGERLFISEYTVHRHMSDIFTRLGVSTRTGAVAKGLREGMI